MKEARTIFAARRPPPREAPPARGRLFFAAGCALGLAFLALGWGASRPRLAALGAPRLPRAARAGRRVWGLVAGFVGSFLVYVWVFTDHVVAHHNQNILLFAPWALALLPLGIGVALGSPGLGRAARAVATAALAAAVAGLILKLGVVRHQENARLLAFALPLWIGARAALAVTFRAADRTPRSR